MSRVDPRTYPFAYRVIYPQDLGWRDTLARGTAEALRQHGFVAAARGGVVHTEVHPDQMAAYQVMAGLPRMECCTALAAS